MFTFLFMVNIFCSVTAFTHSEKLTIFCSIPEKYLLRFINCTVQESPEFYQKASDLLYDCFDQFYENDGKLDCLLQFLCYESGKDINVHRCFIEKTIEELGRPSEEDRNQFDDAVHYCTSHA